MRKSIKVFSPVKLELEHFKSKYGFKSESDVIKFALFCMKEFVKKENYEKVQGYIDYVKEDSTIL